MLFISFAVQNVSAQEEDYQRKIEMLKERKDQIGGQEKDALKIKLGKST